MTSFEPSAAPGRDPAASLQEAIACLAHALILLDLAGSSVAAAHVELALGIARDGAAV